MRARGQRIVSIFCYLTDVEGGGCTHFPQGAFSAFDASDVRRYKCWFAPIVHFASFAVGKRFKPKKGSAVLWFNQVALTSDPHANHRFMFAYPHTLPPVSEF